MKKGMNKYSMGKYLRKQKGLRRKDPNGSVR